MVMLLMLLASERFLRWEGRKALAEGGGSGLTLSWGGDGVVFGGELVRLKVMGMGDSGGGET